MPDVLDPQLEVLGSDGSAEPDGEATRLADTADRHATAEYILDMSGQLAKLAKEARMDLLAYLLDMARIEAELMRNRPPPTKSDSRRRA